MLLLHSLSHLTLVFAAFLVKQYVDELASVGKNHLLLLLAIAALILFSLLLEPWVNLNLYQMTLALRKGLTGLIFAKSMRLSMQALGQASPGKLINLCSGDLAFIES